MMLWDYKTIDVDVLLKLMRFELDPDRLELEIDLRRRSRPWSEELTLFET